MVAGGEGEEPLQLVDWQSSGVHPAVLTHSCAQGREGGVQARGPDWASTERPRARSCCHLALLAPLTGRARTVCTWLSTRRGRRPCCHTPACAGKWAAVCVTQRETPARAATPSSPVPPLREYKAAQPLPLSATHRTVLGRQLAHVFRDGARHSVAPSSSDALVANTSPGCGAVLGAVGCLAAVARARKVGAAP